jgi:hypothetical protein
MGAAPPERHRAPASGAALAAGALALALTVAGAGACQRRPAAAATLPPGDYTPRVPDSVLPPPAEGVTAWRDEALRRSRVWLPPPIPVGEFAFATNPPGTFPEDADLLCRFLPRSSDGLTPKFQCVLAGGQVVKVKYGQANRETRAEVAGSRLAKALGFGADDMSVVGRVRCFGCPSYPYPKFPWWDSLFADYGRYADFEAPVIERLFDGLEIRTPEREGWGFDELARVDASQGGATRAELDALRLFAVFLNHWDAKPDNQRLVCLPGAAAAGHCAQPFALIHDFGATFGPRGANLEGWTRRALFTDPAECTVSMSDLPFRGASFTDTRISEGGRSLLAAQLQQLRPGQVRDLFRAARFEGFGGGTIEQWATAFEERTRQVVDRPACPAS